MRYWWVNQNQTHRQEIAGGYLWSPKRNANGARNPFYEFMREVSPGDFVLSFVDTRIIAIGIVASYCHESPKPAEFGGVGLNWEAIGWRVTVQFNRLTNAIRPKEHIDFLRQFLPERYSPLQTSGNGIQSVYLTELSKALADILLALIGSEAQAIVANATDEDSLTAITGERADVELWEHRIEETIFSNTHIGPTERESLVMARRGQGLFKERVTQIAQRCRITGVNNLTHLRASHCKPWRDANNDERLNGENGLLLTPSIDHLFDRGFIGFEDSGELIISPIAHRPSLNRMGVITDRVINVGEFTEGQRHFLDYHRESVLLQIGH